MPEALSAVEVKGKAIKRIGVTIAVLACIYVLRRFVTSTGDATLTLTVIVGCAVLVLLRALAQHGRITLKSIAGAQFLSLVMFYPRWLLLALNPILIAFFITIAAHIFLSFYRAVKAEDDRLRRFSTELLPKLFGAIVYTELEIVAIALFVWTYKSPSSHERSFTSYGTLAAPLACVVILSVAEIAVLHIILRHYSHPASNVATIIGIVALVYIVGVLKSLGFRPTVVSPDGILARLGILYKIDVPIQDLEGVYPMPPAAVVPNGAAKLSGISAPNVLIKLKAPALLEARFGRPRHVEEIAMRLDRADDFIASVGRECTQLPNRAA